MLLDRPIYIDSSKPPAPEPGKPVEGCWFCLSNPTADTDLIVSIGKPLLPPGSLLLESLQLGACHEHTVPGHERLNNVSFRCTVGHTCTAPTAAVRNAETGCVGQGRNATVQ